MLTVSLIAPVPEAVQLEPAGGEHGPLRGGGAARAGAGGGDRVGDRGPDGGRGAVVRDCDRVGGRGPRNRRGRAVGLGDREVGLRGERGGGGGGGGAGA